MPWRINGLRVYKVKGKKKSRRKTYKAKSTAKKAVRKRGYKTKGKRIYKKKRKT